MVTSNFGPPLDRYKAVLFDAGNTLFLQQFSSEPIESTKVQLLPGVVEALNLLEGKVKLGVVSNTTTMTSLELSAHLLTAEILSPMSYVLATADIGIHKPDPRPLLKALEEMDVLPQEALYVGDNDIDRIAALAAGMDFCFTGPNMHEAMERFCINTHSAWERSLASPREPNLNFADAMKLHVDGLVKPVGSLGRLEECVTQIAAIQRTLSPSVDPCAIAIFCADHGIARDDSVTPWPQQISTTMAGLIAEGRAVSSVFARVNDVYLEVIDVGLQSSEVSGQVRNERVRDGSEDFRDGPALQLQDVLDALEVGAQTAERLIGGGSRTICIGEVGIGNTTIASILIAKLCDIDPYVATGRGSGIDDATLETKRQIVEMAVKDLVDEHNPEAMLARIGGLEVAAMVGCIVSAAGRGVPIVIDGVIAQAAACLASVYAPWSIASCIASHCSDEPASRHALEFLQLQPMFELGLRLGEGTGALLAVPLLRSMCEMTTGVASLSEVM